MEKVTDFDNTIFSEDVIPASSKVVFREGENKTTSKVKKSNVMAPSRHKEYKDFAFVYMMETYKVHFQKNVKTTDETTGESFWIYGNTCAEDRIINISTHSCTGKELTPSQIKTTFCHELVHIILSSGQYFNETQNEPLVEWIAKSLMMTIFSGSDIEKKFK